MIIKFTQFDSLFFSHMVPTFKSNYVLLPNLLIHVFKMFNLNIYPWQNLNENCSVFFSFEQLRFVNFCFECCSILFMFIFKSVFVRFRIQKFTLCNYVFNLLYDSATVL